MKKRIMIWRYCAAKGNGPVKSCYRLATGMETKELLLRLVKNYNEKSNHIK